MIVYVHKSLLSKFYEWMQLDLGDSSFEEPPEVW